MVQVPWNLFQDLPLTRWYSLEWALLGGSVRKGCIFCTFGVQKGREGLQNFGRNHINANNTQKFGALMCKWLIAINGLQRFACF